MNADLHAALLHVTESRCPSLVGISGIVLQETKNVFVLVTSNNQLKSKQQSDTFTLLGRPCYKVERSTLCFSTVFFLEFYSVRDVPTEIREIDVDNATYVMLNYL